MGLFVPGWLQEDGSVVAKSRHKKIDFSVRVRYLSHVFINSSLDLYRCVSELAHM